MAHGCTFSRAPRRTVSNNPSPGDVIATVERYAAGEKAAWALMAPAGDCGEGRDGHVRAFTPRRSRAGQELRSVGDL